MAIVDRRRVVINSGRRRTKRRNRKLTAKQIKYFGTPAQKAALKRKNRRHTAAGTRSRRNTAARRTVSRARAYTHRKSSRNPGDILSMVLTPMANPGRKKGTKMAAHRRRRHHRRSARSNDPRRRHRRRGNPVHPVMYAHNRRRRRHNSPRRAHRRRYYRRNAARGGAGMAQVTQTMFLLVAGGVGFFGSKAATQMVMAANNTGVTGYVGNAIATAALTVAASVLPPTRKWAPAVAAGGILQIIMRILTDYTPFGQVTSSLGIGDYQMQNFATPQRLVDPLNSAQIEIPAGWGAPAVVVSSAAPPAGTLPAPGMHGFNRTGGGLYSGGGMYAS